LCYVLGLGPCGEISVRHGLAVCGRVDDAGEDGVDSDAGPYCVGGMRSAERLDLNERAGEAGVSAIKKQSHTEGLGALDGD